MNLRDEMSRSLGEHPRAEPDVARLTAGARREGRRRVRRRRTAIGAVAVVVIGGLGAGAATQLAGDDSRETVVATDPTTPASPTAPTAPAPSASSTPSAPPSTSVGEGGEPVGTTTGRSAVAGLIQALKIYPDRVYSDFVGSEPDPDYTAGLTYADDAGSTSVRVEVRFDTRPPTCRGASDTSCAEVSGIGGAFSCERGDDGCPAGDDAPFGAVVRSERDLDGPVVRRTVDYRRADGVRIIATAINGVPSGAGYEATRDELGLAYEDLDYVVGQDWWDATMPIALVRDGQALEPYRSE